MTSPCMMDHRLLRTRAKTIGELKPAVYLDHDNGIVNTGSRRFDGVNQSFYPTGWAAGLLDFCFDFWVRSDLSAGQFYRGHSATTWHGVSIAFLAGNTIRLQIANGSALADYNSLANAIKANDWSHVIITCDRDGYARFYIDDMTTPNRSLDISALVALDMAIGNPSHRIGANSSSTSTKCALARFGIVRGHLLTLDERIESHGNGYGKRYAEMSPALQARYLHFWNLDEASGNGVESVSGNTAIAVNGPIDTAPGPGCLTAPFADGTDVKGLISRGTARSNFIQDVAANRPTVSARQIGSRAACTFDGSDDHLTCYQPTALTGNEFTLCIAFHTDSVRFSAVQTLLAFSDIASADDYGRVGIDADGYPFVELNNSGTVHSVRGSTLLELDTDYSLLVWSDGTAWGMQFANADNPENLTVTTANSGTWISDLTGVDVLTLGGLKTSGGNSDLFTGQIGMVTAWNECHSAGVRTSIRNQFAASGGLKQPAIYEGLVEPTWRVDDLANWSAPSANTSEALETILTNNHIGSYRVNCTEAATYLIAQHNPAAPLDLTDKAIRLRYYLSDAAAFTTVRLYAISGESGTSHHYTYSFNTSYRNTGWNYRTLLNKDFTAAGEPSWDNIRYLYLRGTRASGAPFMILDQISLGYTGPAVLIMASDDGNDENYDIAYPALAARNLPITAYVNPGNIGTGSKMTVAELKTLYAAGWDICSHSYTHTNATEISAAEVHTEYSQARAALLNWGFHRSAYFHAYPFNATSAAVRAIAQQYFRNARAWTDERWPPQPNGLEQTWRWSSYGTDEITLDNWKTLIDDAITCGEVVITYWHLFDGLDFEDMLDYAIAKRDAGQLLMMTMSQFYEWQQNRFKNGWHSHQWSA